MIFSFDRPGVVTLFIASCWLTNANLRADEWPALPERVAAVEIPAQEWPQRPGPRRVRVLVHYPGDTLANVNDRTGIMLTLHNWGGTDCVGTAAPQVLADRLNVVALCVNYLQSGAKDSIEGPEPYDHGYLQALDALRALWWTFDGLKARGPFAEGRLFCTGGSGGGNVTLMANKLAPRTFACVVDMCGMKKLSDDIAFNIPGGVDLDARWSRDPRSKSYLSLDEQEIRFVGHPDHLATMRRLGAAAKIIVVHGVDDSTYADATEMVALMQRAKLDVDAKWVTPADVDGKVFASSGHSLGNRTEIVFRVAEKYLSLAGAEKRERRGPTDFERREELRYRTSGGEFVISYAAGFPIGRFEPAPPPVKYDDHHDLLHYRTVSGDQHAVKTAADWEQRRRHIVDNFQLATGPLPSPLRRVPLDVKVVDEVRVGKLLRRKLSYQSDPVDRVAAYLFLPDSATKRPAVLCLQQTTDAGKDEPAGVRGDANMKYALELAERGYVTFAPDYPSFGEHPYDFDANHGYVSGSMKAVWDNTRAIDFLESLDIVDPEKIGCIGHSLGGHNGIFTAVFEPRIKALVSNCGFTSLRKDDLPSWTGPRYMPRIASEFGNDVKRVPFDFPELIAALAPRAFLASAAEQDDDFDVSGVRDVIAAAKPVYELFGRAENLDAHYYAAPHSFPATARQRSYEFLDHHLK